MKQILWQFHFGDLSIPIYGYGLMMVIGFLAAVQLAKFLARRSGLDGETFVNAGLLALVAGIVGARLSHILENLSDFTRSDRSVGANLWAMVNLTSGGLTYYGGFLLAFPTLVFYARRKRIPIRTGMDIVAPCLMIALGFGRIGCFLNGCCYGAQCDVPWAVRFPYYSLPYQDEYDQGKLRPVSPELLKTGMGKPVLRSPDEVAREPKLVELARHEHSLALHPAQLYSTITSWLIAGVAFAYFTLGRAPGRGFALMLMLEGATRFLLEMLRAEPAVLGRMSLSMIVGAGLVILGAGLWIVFGKMNEDDGGMASPLRTAVVKAR